MKSLIGLLLSVCFLGACVHIDMPGVRYDEPYIETELEGSGVYKIVVIDISGALEPSLTQNIPFAPQQMPSKTALLKEQLSLAENDPLIRAVLLRIDSPGGTVTTSDVMYQEIKRFQQRTGKAVVANIGELGASGGYYVAMAADQVLAHPTSLIGSIGVVMVHFDATGLMQMVGVKNNTLKTGEFKDMGSAFKGMSAEESLIYQGILQDYHQQFVKIVASSRKLSEDEIHQIADGRVFSAQQALKFKLIDRIGYLGDSVEVAKRLAGLKEAKVVSYFKPGQYSNNFYSSASAPSQMGLINVNMNGLFDQGSPRFMYKWIPGIR